jgi:energy-coupling factor transporter transmembrane protein EcfT
MGSDGPSSPVAGVHPTARAVAALGAVAGTLLIRQPIPLAALWLVVLLPLIVHARLERRHLVFVCWIVLPVSVALFVVWGFIVGAPPGAAAGVDPAGGIRFATLTTLRLLVLGAIWQLCFLTLPFHGLAATLRSWGIRGDALVACLGSFAVIPEVSARARQVIAARAARGFLGRASWLSRARQLAALLPPLVAWVLRSAVQRDEQWRHRGLIQRFHERSERRLEWSSRGLSLVAGGVFWLAFAIYSRWPQQ